MYGVRPQTVGGAARPRRPGSRASSSSSSRARPGGSGSGSSNTNTVDAKGLLLRDLQDRASRFMQKRASQQRQVEALDERIRRLHGEIDACKTHLSFTSTVSNKTYTGLSAVAENDLSVAKQLSILENRLNALNRRESQAITRNERLVNGVNLLRRSRLRFERTSTKLQRTFQVKRREMARMMAAASRLFEDCQAAEREAEQLEEQEIRDRAACDGEMATLEAYLAGQQEKLAGLASLTAGAGSKSSGRSPTQQDPQRRRRQQQQQQGLRRGRSSARRVGKVVGNMSTNQERDMRRDYKSAKREVMLEQSRMQYAQDKALSYESAFAKLRDETGENNIREIVRIFVDHEDENFSMYNYLQNVQISIKAAERKRLLVDEAIAKYQAEEGDKNELRKQKQAEIEAARDAVLRRNAARLRQDGEHRETLVLWTRALDRLYRRLLDHEHLFSMPLDVGAAAGALRRPTSRGSMGGGGVGGARRRSWAAAGKGDAGASASRGGTDGGTSYVTDHNAGQVLAVVEQCAVEVIEAYVRAAPVLGLKENHAAAEACPSRRRNRLLAMSIDVPPIALPTKMKAVAAPDEADEDGNVEVDNSRPVFADTWRASLKSEAPRPVTKRFSGMLPFFAGRRRGGAGAEEEAPFFGAGAGDDGASGTAAAAAAGGGGDHDERRRPLGSPKLPAVSPSAERQRNFSNRQLLGKLLSGKGGGGSAAALDVESNAGRRSKTAPGGTRRKRRGRR